MLRELLGEMWREAWWELWRKLYGIASSQKLYGSASIVLNRVYLSPPLKYDNRNIDNYGKY